MRFLTAGYYVGAALMIHGGIVAMFLGVGAEQKSLEDVATPLTAQDAEDEGTGGDPDEGAGRASGAGAGGGRDAAGARGRDGGRGADRDGV